MQLAREELEQAYRQMKTIRDFEDHLHREIAKGTIGGFTHLYGGQEAIAVGVCENLRDTDYITSTHRGHGHCIAKGCDVKGMMKELYGRADGLCKGKGGSMHVADMDVGMLGANGIVGGGPPLATGAALAAMKINKKLKFYVIKENKDSLWFYVDGVIECKNTEDFLERIKNE